MRDSSRDPGNLRRIQNWIGRPGSTIEEAEYIPISADKLPDAISDWEKFIHEDYPDPLVQLSILHVEFEALHPFLDGNGRMGRLFVPLFLYSRNLIKRPILYISAYLEEHRDEYYARLLAVSRDDDWYGWCKFFLTAIASQAETNQKMAVEILQLYDEMKITLTNMIKSQYSAYAVEWIFQRPIFSSSDFMKDAGIPSATEQRILGVLKANHILTTIREGSGRRSSILRFDRLLAVADR